MVTRMPTQGPSTAEVAVVDVVASAEAAGLRYVSRHDPGIRRLGRAGRFRYVDAHAKPVRDSATLVRIRALVLPPAWQDVWICHSKNGHLQAAGRDARGRWQYRYHARWREVRDEAKYERMIAFARALPRIRRAAAKDASRRRLSREKVLATVVRLLEMTLIRVGNEEYARSNDSFGLSTLRTRHVDVSGDSIRFQFRGKSGKKHSIRVADRQLARAIQRIQDLPGQRLFQFEAADGTLHDVESGDVNAYLRQISGGEFTAKDFRTWAGTVLAAMALREMEHFTTEVEARRNVVAAIEHTAARLGNTPVICRKCYIHPRVLDAYLDGSLLRVMEQRAARRLRESLTGLGAEETAVLALLQRQMKRGLERQKKSSSIPRSRR